jgi:hypothetical protein
MQQRNAIQNNVFGSLKPEDMSMIQKKVVPDSRLRLCSTFMAPSREVVPIAECLVAYDTRSDTIVKFISAFIPPPRDNAHKGIKYLISKDDAGDHKPVVIAWNGIKKEGSFWNPHFLTAYLDFGKLPMSCETAEFRVLRAYRAGIRAPARFELLAFDMPKPGHDVDKHTMQVEAPFNSVPPIQLARCYKHLYWWQKQIIDHLGAFAEIDLMSALGLGIKRNLDQAVAQGALSSEVKDDILHDHSDDPVEEVSESLGESFARSGKNMVQANEGEGHDFYVPDNPLLKTMPHKADEDEDTTEEKENEEQAVQLYD